jgi:multiple sugar transport system ATP-binding protein
MIYVTHDQVEAMTMGDRICMMKDGRIQQVAQPLEIYHEPANMFVAAFIGSPPMNFFEGTIIAREGRLLFSEKVSGRGTDGILLAVPDRPVPQLKAWLNKPIYLGLRPEDIVDRKPGSDVDPGRTIRATIDLVEEMGPETLFYLKSATHSFIVRTQGHAPEKAGGPMELVANMAKAHFFEAADSGPYKKDSGALDLEKWQAACRRIV